MNMQELMGSLGQNREEVLKDAVQCATTEELMQLGRDNNITLSEQEAVEILDALHPASAELTENELDAVTGGAIGPGGAK
ncbi:MAG: hypothetical protein M0R49_00345 [Limnochordia bacterium]|jgi:hypothetical protein|nr:hypothetical protein [Limnochordia bacterium]